MGIDIEDILSAGRVPRELLPWNAGRAYNACEHDGVAFLFHVCIEGLHVADRFGEGLGGYTVMDDSPRELKRHLQAVHAARGRVLKTGLGFGCFVRMALQKDDVEHIDVIEINPEIASHFGAEFSENPRVSIHCEDALSFNPEGQMWDFAWHDIYCDGNDGLQTLHAQLINKFYPHCAKQGAWAFPRHARRCPHLV